MTRFVQLTDLHISHPDAGDTMLRTDTPAQVAQAVEAINRLVPPPDFVIASGDLTNMGDAQSYALLQQILAPLRMPVVLALGNHDRRAAFHTAYATGQGDGPHFHDAVLAGLHVITLDTLIPGRVSGTLCDAQFAFLADALDREPGLPKLIVAHHPPRLHDGELPWATLDQAATDRLAEALAGRDVLGVLSGHVHINSVRMWHGVPLYVSQGLNSTVDLVEREDMRIVEGTGFALFDLRPAGLTVTFVPLSPQARELGRLEVARLRSFS
jgi:3',5'-cyclic AMP phosphodiesterase CpdA